MHFEFTDAEVAACTWQQGRLQLRFSAARVVVPRYLQDEVAWAPVVLSAEGVEPWEPPTPAMEAGRLCQGWVLHDSQRMQQLAVPCQLQGPSTVELALAQGGLLRFRCHSLVVHPIEGAGVAAYQC